MKRLTATTLIVMSAILQPIQASSILPALEQTDMPAQFIDQLICPSGNFDFDKARNFIFQLKHEIKMRYGLDIDLKFVTTEAIERLRQTGQFSEIELQTAHQFYEELLSQNKPHSHVLNARKMGKKKHKHKKEHELVLPDKMAGGFICILGGALLCIVPFGFTQAFGTGLIITGVAVTVDASAAGERPYYVDSKTGEVTPINPPSSNQGMGVGKSF